MTDHRATESEPRDSGDTGGTPEGHTPEAPAADEFGKKGTPAAGLSPALPHAADADDAHATDLHTAGGHGEDEHAAEVLGPIDRRAWAASALGIVIALGLCLFLALPTLGQ